MAIKYLAECYYKMLTCYTWPFSFVVFINKAREQVIFAAIGEQIKLKAISKVPLLWIFKKITVFPPSPNSRGRFGTVYLCNCKRNGLKFAAKFVNTKRNQDRQNVEREIEIMRVLNEDGPHPKLIQLYDAYDLGKEICLILEL